MKLISIITLPIIVLFIIIYGSIKKVDIYDSFVKGAKEGLVTSFNIFPYMISMVFAINIFTKSNFLNFIFKPIEPILNNINLSSSIFPLIFLRPISGNGSLVILNNILAINPDNLTSLLASTIQGSTDTTIYILTLYFGSVGIKKIRHALKAGLFADLMGAIFAFFIVYILFSW